MYGLPANMDWNFLVGRELIQMCVGIHQVLLRFDGDVSVSIECVFEHSFPGAKTHSCTNLAHRAKSLVTLLGTRVERVDGKSHEALVLSFSNHETLQIHDSNEMHESFLVHAPGIEIVV